MKKRLIKTAAAIVAAALVITGVTAARTAYRVSRRNREPEPEIVDAVNKNVNKTGEYNPQNADYTLDIDASAEIRDISDMLYGIFFEDINFAADGGLYAEMVANRSFEFSQLAKDDQLYAWSAVNGAETEVMVNDTENCLNENNTNYLVIKNGSDTPAGIANRGFLDGMYIEEGKAYNFSVYLKSSEKYTGEAEIRLVSGDTVLAQGKTGKITGEWKKYEMQLTAEKGAGENVALQVLIGKGQAECDMVSLFPSETYKNRENGLRKDLCEALEDLHPRFLRFPGGCVIEGEDEVSRYRWKDTVAAGRDGLPLEFNGRYGDVAARKQGENIWTDHAATDDEWPSFMTYGLGFYEFFQLSEDIGATGVPVLNPGLHCQMRGKEPMPVDSEEFRGCVQDMLDLVEFCRAGEDSVWGRVRISMGHEKPFELKYIAVGNENEGEDYFTRYQIFLDTFNKAKKENPGLYEGIELIYSSGASDATHGANYLPSYEYAKSKLNDAGDASQFAGATDQHYYNSPEWFLRNTDYYDENNYSRTIDKMTDTKYGGAIQVFLGEYAARSNTMKAALAEASYMTALERNGDIVRMACYAPLFGNTTATHWSPDLIWFSKDTVTRSVNYFVQKMFSDNAGSSLLKSTLGGAEKESQDLTGKVGVGVWYTKAYFDNLKVTDNDTGKTLAKATFTNPFSYTSDWIKTSDDNKFKIRKGALLHDDTWMSNTLIGGATYLDKEITSENYTYTLEATKLDGAEGFLIPFAVRDADNNYFWNIGGWTNTISCLQRVENGEKTDKIDGTIKDFSAETGKTYKLKIVVKGTVVKCYIDDELYVDYDTAVSSEYEAYQVVSTDETGDIIVKFVNVTRFSKVFACNISGKAIKGTADVVQLSADTPDDINTPNEKESTVSEEFTIEGLSEKFNYSVPAYSVTVMRIKTS